MKVVICLSFLVLLAYAERITPKILQRDIKADVLRGKSLFRRINYDFTLTILLFLCLSDFPGLCYASTLCRTFKEGEEWDLKPFCGKSACTMGADGL